MSVLSFIPEEKLKNCSRDEYESITTPRSSKSIRPRRRACRSKDTLQNVYSSNSRLSLLTKRKRLNPLGSAMSNQSLNSKAGGDRYVTQRVLSAKTHRVKQLQNQLADAHYQLQELSNENRVLRALQKKQEIALQRYENSNAELPQVLNSHNEELRIQQSKYKQLKQQYKEVAQKLKERDIQFQQMREEHQHLLDLSKDRNLLEREKLQAQVSELTAKVQQQNEMISMLQRRIVLEAKNFRHQLQNEINKHKDTRHDLDLAINNADKLSTIIEMKEKMISTQASRGQVKSPSKGLASSQMSVSITKPVNKMNKTGFEDKNKGNVYDDRINGENSFAKLCENSRSLSSALSHDEEISSSLESRSKYARSRMTSSSTSKSTPNQTRKSSKGSDEINELAKSVQDGMAIFDDDIDLKNSTSEEVQKKLDTMKQELLNKIKADEAPSRKASGLRRRSTEESIEEQIENMDEIERPKSRGRRNSAISFYDDVTIEESTTTVFINEHKTEDELNLTKLKREPSNLHKKISEKPIEKYCKDIIHDIERSNKVIDKHVKDFNNSRFECEKLAQQLQAVDKINDFVNSNGEIPENTLVELNNNFKMLTEQVIPDGPVARKRSISNRRTSRPGSNTNLFGDANMSNRDLLEDLLGKK